MTKTEICSEK